MLALYRSLLRLYPSAFQHEFAGEMLAVLAEVQQDVREKPVWTRVALPVRESIGLLYGALLEHLRTATGFNLGGDFLSRRVKMHSEFRFPKATVFLMAVILLAILMAIDKARSIQLSGPYPSPQVGAIKGVQFALVPTLLIVLAGACVAGVIGWTILFALRRSGIHRLSEMNPSQTQRTRIF